MQNKGWVKVNDYGGSTGRRELNYQLTDYGEGQLRHELRQLGGLLELAEHHLAIRAAHRTEDNMTMSDMMNL